jgi:hypothetical protein
VLNPVYTAPDIMRNLIIGIVSILCLQISYQVFLAVDRTSENYNAMSPVDTIEVEGRELASLTDPVPAPYSVVPVRSVPTSRRVAAEPVKRALPDQRSNVMAVKRPRPKSVNVETIDHFAVKTAYARDLPQAPNARIRPSEVVSTHVEPKENRSFFAKALPVIKKPYDWMKAIGSKLK